MFLKVLEDNWDKIDTIYDFAALCFDYLDANIADEG